MTDEQQAAIDPLDAKVGGFAFGGGIRLRF